MACIFLERHHRCDQARKGDSSADGLPMMAVGARLHKLAFLPIKAPLNTMKASPVLLLSLGMLASAVPSSKQADTRDVSSNNHGSGLASRGSKAGPLSARDAKALSFRRHKQAMKRLQRRRASDDTTDDDFTTDNDDDDTDTDTDDDLAPPPPPPPPPAPVQSITTTVHVPRDRRRTGEAFMVLRGALMGRKASV